MNNLIIYIHGKGGSAEEAGHYEVLSPECEAVGFDYKSETPWDAKKEFSEYFDTVCKGYDGVYLIAVSIGAYFAVHSLGQKKIKKAFFISPIADMETLIGDMLRLSGFTEADLKDKKEIITPMEKLSWEYLSWVKKHPAEWEIPTAVLYGEKDELQSYEAVREFSDRVGAELTVMENGEHWFHTEEEMKFSDNWIKNGLSEILLHSKRENYNKSGRAERL